MSMLFVPNLDPVNKEFLMNSCKLKSENIRNQIDEVIGIVYTIQYDTGEWYTKMCDLSNNVYYYEDSYKRIVERKR